MRGGVGVSARDTAAPSQGALQAAAQWFALLRSGAASEQDRSDWRRWFDASREHREAWQYVDAISRRFAAFQTRQEQRAAVAALQVGGAAPVGRRRLLTGLALAAGAGWLGWSGWRSPALRGQVLAWNAKYRTDTGQIRRIGLAPDTYVWLNTASALNTDSGRGRHRLELLRGEVLVDSTSAAPLWLDTRHGRLRAADTRFSVRLDDDSTLLSVIRGEVALRTAESGATRIVEAGRQLRFNGAAAGAPQPLRRAREAWSNGVLLAEDIPLRELIEELGRYRVGHLSVAPEVADLRVLGGFPLRDPDKVLAMLERTLPIRVQRTLPWWISIEARG